MKYDVLVVGSGFAGSVIARQLAENYNKTILIMEKREQIGGNMAETYTRQGIRIHKYGPHIFHTNQEVAYAFIKQFSDFYPYEHRVLGRVNDQFVPIPFNFTSLERLFPAKEADKIKLKLQEAYSEQKKVSVLKLMNCSDPEIKHFGEYVYEYVFAHYSEKQWQIPSSEIDPSVINRVPVVLGYDDRYFQDQYQYMPVDGYSKLFERLLDHKNISVALCCDALKRLRIDCKFHSLLFDNEAFTGPVIYTGAPDELLDYRLGKLPYRSLNLVVEEYSQKHYQTAAVVNYPNEELFTRITEFKHITKQKAPLYTAITKEYPMKYNPEAEVGNIPYYPIENRENRALLERYQSELKRFSNLYLCGRLAEYQYYNMDATIIQALHISKQIGAEM